MGFFTKLFEKKVCNACGNEIKFLGNKKLADGNLCKDCAAKLSPWFDERRNSTVEQILAQLDYREQNKEAVAAFHVTSSYGEDTKLLVDEDSGKFVVTGARKLEEVNPDVLDFSQVTGVTIDVDENRSEEKREVVKPDGAKERVSFNPPRYYWQYNFYIAIHVNHPYFDEMRFRLNQRAIELNPGNSYPIRLKPDPRNNNEYRHYEDIANAVKAQLMGAREQARAEAAEKNAPKAAVLCPYCGATTTPDAANCCEYCGGPLNG